MPQINFADVFDKLKNDVANLAELTVKTYVKDAKKVAGNLLNALKTKLERWTLLLASGDLTTEDFELLVNSQKDLAEMEALKQAGLAAIRVDQFKDSVFNLIVDTVFHMVPL